ncbi:MAG: DNA gyrase subunit A [Pseudomonadota bacterium]
MADLAREITPVNIEDELKQSYLDYAMSVIVGRALPDVRDGLKPVHRRVLFAMHELGNEWNKPYKKSARVVGDVIGKYHPHGDSAVYDTIVRMAQSFSLRYMLVDGQGNFGSVDGDSAAAMRYTEVRMSRIAHDLLADLEKETVDWVPNYDGSEQIPAVLPTRIPNLLVNGSAGIAVGMATNIPPHNLTEVINGCLAFIDDESITIDGLIEHIKGPDFPTAAIINGRAGIVEAYRTGRGRVHIRARATIEPMEKGGREAIIITEIPYQLNKARLIEKIAELVKEKKVEGISELRDESDKDGMRIVIELRKDAMGEVVLNNLYAQTQLQSVFGINMVALVDGQPRILNLKDFIGAFIRHRREVVTRRTVFELRKARERGHILEGLAVALANIDPIIVLIKASPTAVEARESLVAQGWVPGVVNEMLVRAGDENACRPEGLPPQLGLRNGKYWLSAEQAQAILDLRLQKLTGLEHEKLIAEYGDLLTKIRELALILADPERLMQVIREELIAVREQFGDARRTEIMASREDFSTEDLIANEAVVLTISHTGYAKTQPLSDYRAQKRGGRGKSATAVKDEDYIQHMLVANMHDTVLCFTSNGRVYWLKVYELPQGGRGSRGKPLVNLLSLADNEKVTAILPLQGFDSGKYVFMATGDGTVKKVELEAFSRPRTAGIIAIDLAGDDKLVGVSLTSGDNDIMLFSNEGQAIRFHESDVRAMGRNATGVRGIRLPDGIRVVSLIVADTTAQVLTACANGFGKRTPVDEFRLQGRGGGGTIAIQTSDRNGELVAAVQVHDADQLMLISDQGTLVRTRVDEVRETGRNAQGVTLIKLDAGEKLVGIVRVEDIGDDDIASLADVAGVADAMDPDTPDTPDTAAE